MKAAGLTVEQLEKTLAERLSEYLTAPQVGVSVAEYRSQPVSVLGAVNKPGVYQLRGGRTLLEVLSMAEGTKPDAAQTVQITRRREHGPIPRLQARGSGWRLGGHHKPRARHSGPRSGRQYSDQTQRRTLGSGGEKVYVLGLVHKPGAFGLTDGRTMSVLQALSFAGGPAPTASIHKAKILRAVAGSDKRAEIDVNLRQVLDGKNTDVVLGPEDVLYVPSSVAKRAGVRALEAALQTVTGMAIWWPR